MILPRPGRQSALSKAFTLVEMLVAVSVLALLVLLMSSVITMVTEVWMSGRARADNYSQAKMVLGMIDRDMQSILVRSDLPAFHDATGTNRAFAFYTGMPGGEGDRRLSLVEYKLPGTNGLLRADYGLDYATLSPNRIPSLGGSTALPDLANATARPIAEGVVAFTWQFVDGTGSLRDDFRFDYTDLSSTANTRTVLVSIVVLDNEAAKMAARQNAYGTLASVLGGGPAANQSHADYWRSLIDSPGFGTALPLPVRQALRVLEHSVSIPLPP